MWSKGAVVVIKRGDKEMADAIVDGLDIRMATDEEVKNLRRDNELLKRRAVKDINAKIAEAEAIYGHNWVPPKWAKRILEGFAFIVYHFCVLIEKLNNPKEG